MAAIFAASGGAETLLVERTKDGGRKILISGGGRCNILPARLDESRFVTDSSPHLLRRIVRSTSSVSAPSEAAKIAAIVPAAPAPTTTTRGIRRIGGRSG